MYWKLNTQSPPTIKHDRTWSNTPGRCLPAKDLWRLGCFLTLRLSAQSSCSRKAFACFCCKNWLHPVSGGRDVPNRGWPWWQERTHTELDGRFLPGSKCPPPTHFRGTETTLSPLWLNKSLCYSTYLFGCIGSSWRHTGSSFHHVRSFLVVHELASHSYRLSCPEACGILVTQPGIEPASPALQDGILNHWTTRESPWLLSLFRPLYQRPENYFFFFSLKGQIVSILGFVGQRVLLL